MPNVETEQEIVKRLVAQVDVIMEQHSGTSKGTFPRVARVTWTNRQADKITQEASGVILECPRLGFPHVLLGTDGTVWSSRGEKVNLKEVTDAITKFEGLLTQAQTQGSLSDAEFSRLRKKR